MDVRHRKYGSRGHRPGSDVIDLEADDKHSTRRLFFVVAGLLVALCTGLTFNKRFQTTKRQSDQLWWQSTIIYQIYPRSFQDSDGDGVGDLKGITQRLDYIKSLNVRAIWLNPFFRSPMRDFGYDVSNHTDIDPLFGNMEDFKQLLAQAHSKGIKVILDFVPNHTSDLHQWFQLSREGVAPYKHYYIWSRGGTRPNNWLSIFRGSSWTRDEVRGEMFYHAFLPQQPDLNWRCPQLQEAMMNILRFWLDLGVDGFRVDAIQSLYETQDLARDEPSVGSIDVDQDSWFSLRHDYTFDQPEIAGAVRASREVLNEYEARDGRPRFLVAETLYDNDVSIRNRYYKYGADMPFNFDLQRLNRSCGGYCVKGYVQRELGHLNEGEWPNFVVGNHDNPRISSKMGPEFINAINMLLLTLPGTPTTYYGEEIGMTDVPVTFDEGRDLQAKRQGEEYFLKFSRDPSRTPMRWDDKKHAGFTSGSVPWLPIGQTRDKETIQGQSNSPTTSHLKLYRKLAVFRDEFSFENRRFEYAVVNDNIFSYIRNTFSNKKYLITLNFGANISTDDYSVKTNRTSGTITMTTENFPTGYRYNPGSVVDLQKISLRPGEGVIVNLA